MTTPTKGTTTTAMTTATTTTVRIAVTDAPGLRIDLVGDAARIDGRPWPWDRGLPMHEEQPGAYVLDVELAPGVYRCKLRIAPHTTAERWRLLPDVATANHIDRVEGVENTVIVVGGRPTGPDDGVFFAPDRRHLHRAGNQLTVVAEAINDGPRPRAVLLEGDSGTQTLPLVVVATVADRVLLRASGAVGDAVSVGFDDDPIRFPLPPPPVSAPPAWLEGAVLYGIFLDRWHRGSSSPPDRRARPRPGPSSPGIFYGGDLDGVSEALPWLHDLGVDAIVLTPLHQSHTPHRYDAIDPLVVDDRLGGSDALRRLVDAAHTRSLRVVVDASLTHVNELHAAFQDVLLHQERSPYASWFRLRSFPVRRRDASTFEHYYRCPELPWLDLRGPAADHALAAIDVLLACGVDGVRFDAMDDAPDVFWRRARARVRAHNPEALLLGEVVGDDVWRRAGDDGCDVVTDFRLRDALLAFARGSIDAPTLVERLVVARHRSGAFPPSYRLAFLDNHDTTRALSQLGGDVVALRRALTLLFFLDETVWLTAGTKAHLGVMRHEALLDDAWPDRLPMPPLGDTDPVTTSLIRSLALVRRETRACPLVVEEADGRQLVLRRGPRRAFLADGEPRLA